MSATIMLATNFDIDKTTFPVYVSEKMDGVPVKIFWTSKGWKVITRQGKTVTSITLLVQERCLTTNDSSCSMTPHPSLDASLP